MFEVFRDALQPALDLHMGLFRAAAVLRGGLPSALMTARLAMQG
jgi:hypothetical protein